MSSNEILLIHIPGHIVPKQRPQIGKKGAYYTPSYRQCLLRVKMFLRENLPTQYAQKGINLSITFYGSTREYGRSDLDNLAGTIMDGLVNTGWIANDSVTWIPKLTLSYQINGESYTEVIIERL